MARRFADRQEAGAQLGAALEERGFSKDVVVLGLPRGGVPVAYQVADRLEAPLDILVVRKIGVPGHRELAMGAVASGGTVIRNREVADWIGISDVAFDDGVTKATEELRAREASLRGSRSRVDVRDKTVIVVDDGMATGSTMKAAVEALRTEHPEQIIVAVPVAAPETVREMIKLADSVVCLLTPRFLRAVGAWYHDFGQTTDEEVRRLLETAGRT
ncbi:MAG: phosphoribosyltransferase [Actinobacteria bacterium]|nr:MAG: phosphoribosyltransferase [Actinomycetota bacterium]REK40545.1 MAG: phosphoribosyltransferase [Actinomycetota bacterium]